MATINTRPESQPLWQRPKVAHHFRSHDEEFDASKLGMWLFLATEVLLFGGIFLAYTIFRYWYPEAFRNGSGYLSPFFGGLNTVVLLISSWTMAMSIHYAQTNQQTKLRVFLMVTFLAGLAFLVIKLVFEYIPKWSLGKRPGIWFNFPGASDPHEPIWWSIYYGATSLHALHVIIGMSLIFWVFTRSLKGMYGPKHYTGVEVVGLYWHLVDLIWIFLFPLLYLIH